MKEFKVSEAYVKVSAFIKSGWIKTIISKPERCLSFVLPNEAGRWQ
jgi:hypothetical protein